MSDPLPSMTAVSQAAFTRAKDLYKRSDLLNMATLVCIIATVFPPEKLAYVAAGLAFFFQVGAKSFAYYANELRKKADLARRRGLLIDSFGFRDAFEEANMHSDLPEQILTEATRREDPRYYSSLLRQGFERLKENLCENALYTKYLYSVCSRHEMLKPALLFAGVMAFTVFVPGIYNGPALLKIARIVTALLGWVVAFGSIGKILRWYTASNEIDRLLHQMPRMDFSKPEVSMAVFCDYNVITASAPLIPDSTHEKHKDHIDRLWKSAKKELYGGAERDSAG